MKYLEARILKNVCTFQSTIQTRPSERNGKLLKNGPRPLGTVLSMKTRRSVKRQHYVPQFYLQNFIKAHGYLFGYDKQNNQMFCSDTESAASLKYFYDLQVGPKRTQFIEKFFSTIEGFAASDITQLADVLQSNAFSVLPTRSRGDLAMFIALQYIRTLRARQGVLEMVKKFAHRLGEIHLRLKFPDSPDPKFEIDVPQDKEALLHFKSLLEPSFIRELQWIVYNHIWTVLRNETNGTFCTSDHPVVLDRLASLEEDQGYGIASKGVIVYLPLSPIYSLMLLERRFFANFEPADGKLLVTRDLNKVDKMNLLQVQQSARHVFSAEDNLQFAVTVCDTHPELRHPSNRVQIEEVALSDDTTILRIHQE